jgi:hypothetical protein
MSEVFVASGKSGQLRYFAPAILVDVSESGLALMMDIAPEGHHIIHVRNKYFDAAVVIRNVTRLEVGVRIGGEFTKTLQWKPEKGRSGS